MDVNNNKPNRIQIGQKIESGTDIFQQSIIKRMYFYLFIISHSALKTLCVCTILTILSNIPSREDRMQGIFHAGTKLMKMMMMKEMHERHNDSMQSI